MQNCREGEETSKEMRREEKWSQKRMGDSISKKAHTIILGLKLLSLGSCPSKKQTMILSDYLFLSMVENLKQFDNLGNVFSCPEFLAMRRLIPRCG